MCMFLSLPTLSDSDHEGLGPGRSGSMDRGSSFRWKSSNAQSMIRMMRWGGLPSLRTVEMSAALIVYRDNIDMYLEMAIHTICLRILNKHGNIIYSVLIRILPAVQLQLPPVLALL